MKRILWVNALDRSREKFTASHEHFRANELHEGVQAAMDALLWHYVSDALHRFELAMRDARVKRLLNGGAA